MEAMIASATHLLSRIFGFRVNKKSDLRNFSRYSLWFTQISNVRHWAHLTFRIFPWRTRLQDISQAASRMPVGFLSLFLAYLIQLTGSTWQLKGNTYT